MGVGVREAGVQASDHCNITCVLVVIAEVRQSISLGKNAVAFILGHHQAVGMRSSKYYIQFFLFHSKNTFFKKREISL